MSKPQKANIFEKSLLMVYKYAPIWILVVSSVISYLFSATSIMNIIVEKAEALSVTGVAIAAFLFTAQSILVAVPRSNAFVQVLKSDGHYLVFAHRFCRISEISFLLLLIPMLYMSKKIMVYNIVVFAGYLFALSFALWSMWLIGSILIKTEKHSVQ